MASKKISHNLASNIARRIAEKAFEHLIAPLEKQMEIFGKEGYFLLIDGIDINLLKERGIVCNEGPLVFKVRKPSDESEDSAIALQCDTGWRAYGWATPTLIDLSFWERVVVVSEKLKGYVSKRFAFQSELRIQLEGKSSAAATKAWPEAAFIIAEECGYDPRPMTVPLEELLMKFLPMLPAPKIEEENNHG